MASGPVNPDSRKPDAAAAKAACVELLHKMYTLQLATVGEDGAPHIGYTPYVQSAPGRFLVFVSTLAAHTRDMLATGKAAVLIIDDESDSSQRFARRRASYQCSAGLIAPTDLRYHNLLDELQDRHGKMLGLLRQLPDFQLIELQAHSAQFVMGFGQAFRVTGEALDQFEHARTG